ncbi:hemerythrin [Magnetospirillum sp. ME-1]|uniref:bacteriohemerythrin n=1 Tax=Magnetospirillum sp. ME-1 TaxID=1639348 RepID=UPI000A17F8CE|nr:bacteriohemerythrin [Magnetospirillum sp. ME-1]ARJ67373.1 hemerythrin [Magnetospirillum sp. ME-1]
MAEHISWSDDLLVGVEAIDSDHKKLFELMNRLLASPTHGATAVSQAIGDLSSYTKRHFAAEIASMERSAYPERSAHAYEHDHLIFQLENIIDRLMISGADAVDGELSNLLRDWLCNHIMTFDVKYAAFLRESGQTG